MKKSLPQHGNTNFIEPETISLRLGKKIISRLRDKAMKDSIRLQSPVTINYLVRAAIIQCNKDLFDDL
jgi:hypothetical protein